MDASTVDAVVDALRALLEDPAFRRLDGSFAAAFEDEHASTARERFEAYAREVRPLVETKVRDVVEEYDFDALASAIARREDPNEIAAHDSTFQLLASTRDVSHFATRARSRRRHLRGRDDDDDDAAFGVETMSVEEHERREAALERETEDGRWSGVRRRSIRVVVREGTRTTHRPGVVAPPARGLPRRSVSSPSSPG